MALHRILIVDDEEGMREVCADTIGRLDGVEVVQQADPLAAAALLEEQSFDVMISDIRMPGMDGVSLLRKAREHDPNLPVLMLTARDRWSDKVAGIVRPSSRQRSITVSPSTSGRPISRITAS